MLPLWAVLVPGTLNCHGLRGLSWCCEFENSAGQLWQFGSTVAAWPMTALVLQGQVPPGRLQLAAHSLLGSWQHVMLLCKLATVGLRHCSQLGYAHHGAVHLMLHAHSAHRGSLQALLEGTP